MKGGSRGGAITDNSGLKEAGMTREREGWDLVKRSSEAQIMRMEPTH
jgi:hypothetical protein